MASMRSAIDRVIALDPAGRDQMARPALDLVPERHALGKFVERQFEIIESVHPGAGATGEHS